MKGGTEDEGQGLWPDAKNCRLGGHNENRRESTLEGHRHHRQDRRRATSSIAGMQYNWKRGPTTQPASYLYVASHLPSTIDVPAECTVLALIRPHMFVRRICNRALRQEPDAPQFMCCKRFAVSTFRQLIRRRMKQGAHSSRTPGHNFQRHTSQLHRFLSCRVCRNRAT